MKRQNREVVSGWDMPKKSCPKIATQETEKSAVNHQIKLEQEALHLTNNNTYFPELVWEIIVKNMKTSSNIENCSNSGPFFDKLLRKKRETEVVLPKVFEILAEKYAKSEDTSYKETNLQSITWNRPEGQPIHKMTGLWKCRLVCKSWNKAIEDLHQQMNVGHHINMCAEIESRTPAPKNSHLLKYAKYALTTRLVDRFLEQFSATHYDIDNKIVTKNPFLGRSVLFPIIPTETHLVLIGYRNGIQEILEKWGPEIWFCAINHLRFGGERDEIEFYRLFRQSIIRMPNLKALHVWYMLISNFVELDYRPLKREIRESPLPTLPNLMHLSTVNLPGPILDHLICVNNIPEGNIFVRNN